MGDSNEKGIRSVITRTNESKTNLGATFSTDSQYILAGLDDNDINIYHASSGQYVTTLKGHAAPVEHIRCNKKYDVIASSCVNTALWIRGSTTVETVLLIFH